MHESVYSLVKHKATCIFAQLQAALSNNDTRLQKQKRSSPGSACLVRDCKTNGSFTVAVCLVGTQDVQKVDFE